MKSNRTPEKQRFISLRVKTLMASTLFFLSVFIVLGVALISASRSEVDAILKEDLLETLEGAASGVDVELLLSLAAEGAPNEEGFSDDPRYLALLGWLDAVHQVEPGAWPYLYLPGPQPNEVVFVVDLYALYDPGTSSGFLEVYQSNSGFILIGLERQTFRHVEGPFVQSLRDWADRSSWAWMQHDLDSLADWLIETGLIPNQEFGIYTDKYGRWASGYMPLTDQAGNQVAGIGVDFSADQVEAQYRQARMHILKVLVLSSALPLLFLYLLISRFAWPVRDLTEVAARIQADEGVATASFTGLRNVLWQDEIDWLAEVLQMMVEKIRQRERQYLAVISTQNEVIVRVSPDGKFNFTNKAYHDLRGEKGVSNLSEITGAGIHPDEQESALRFLSDSLAALTPENPQCQIELRMYDPNENLRWLLWTITGLYDEAGTLTEYQGVGQDITPLKETQQQLERARTRMQELSHDLINARERERGDLAREIHDDLLNYLSELMIDLGGDVPSEMVKETYQMIAERARQTIFELRPPMLSYGLYPGLQDYVTSLTERAGEQVRIEFSVENAGPTSVKEMGIHFFRIVQQACENALEHASPTHLVISGYLGEGRVFLRVEDDGEGFDWGSGDFLDAAISQKHFGLAGMLERGAIIGAPVEISSAPGTGTRVSVNWEASSGE